MSKSVTMRLSERERERVSEIVRQTERENGSGVTEAEKVNLKSVKLMMAQKVD